ncbi:MAG: OsmC family protein [Acidimicrobiales bacterium]|jgi:uncharacterized OsmC-like protein|nr:OsmC family protein [Acidimicrobiales bacterium]
MGIVDRALLKENLDTLEAQLGDDPTSGIVRPTVSTSLIQDVRAVSRFTQYGKEFEFRCDESEGRGGRGEAPSPLRYLLTSLAFCQQVWYAKGAALVGCEVERLDIDVDTYMDMRGEHLVDGQPTHPQWFRVTASVTSPSPEDAVLAMAREANRRCPVYGLLASAVPVYSRLEHNGTVIMDSEIDESRGLFGEE